MCESARIFLSHEMSAELHFESTITANTYSTLAQEYKHTSGSTDSMQEHTTIKDRPYDRLGQTSRGMELRQSDNDRKFEYLEQELSAILKNLTASTSTGSPDIPNFWRNQARDHEHEPMSRHRPSCTCRCHTMRSSHKSSRWAITAFKSTLGSFSLYFSANNGRTKDRPCTSPDCEFTCSSSSTVRMAYTFPKWLYLRAVAAVFSNKSGAPELLIRIVRRIAPAREADGIIGDIQRRDLRGVQRTLQTRQYSVFDTMFDGTSMILLALMKEDIGIVKLLLCEGADVFLADDHGNKPYRDILMQIYASPHLPLSYRQELERLMPVGEIVEATELPDLHKVVLGIRCLDIREYLRTDVDVTATDVFGRSALWYASCKGDLTAVQALLAADMQTPAATDRRVKAVHIASRHNHVDVLRCLLDHHPKVSIDSRTMWSFTPLMSNAQSPAPADDTALELIRRGADLDAHNLDGTTALHVASKFDRVGLVEILVASGADINRCDKTEGTSPLAKAIQVNSQCALMALLRLGADHHVRNHAGQGVAHLLGKFADVETMEILMRAPHFLARLDTAAGDAQGKTPMQICLERDSESQNDESGQSELSRSFASLLEAIQACSQVDEGFAQGPSGLGEGLAAADADGDDDDDDDVFFEAPETLAVDNGKSARSGPDVSILETAISSPSPVRESSTASNLHHRAPEDPFVDTNKYRFPEHTNSNGTKTTTNMRMEHLERGVGPRTATTDRSFETPIQSPGSRGSEKKDKFKG